MRLLDLPTWLERWDLPHVLVDGWETRGRDLPDLPLVVVGHHTATPARAHGDLPTLRILRDGRADLPGPLCQLAIARSGVVHVIASGKANHAGRGAWHGVSMSSQTIGIEAEHPGVGRWAEVQMDAFDRLAACLLWGLGQSYDAYCHHKEWALPKGRKVDCNFDPSAQRGRIARLLVLGPPQHEIPAPPPQEDDVARLIRAPEKGAVYGTDGVMRWHVPEPAVLDDLKRTGVYGDGTVHLVAQKTIDALPLKESS